MPPVRPDRLTGAGRRRRTPAPIRPATRAASATSPSSATARITPGPPFQTAGRVSKLYAVFTVCSLPAKGKAVISGLHHYALEVPDLAVAEGFLQDFGLETGEKDGSLVAMCPGRQQEQVRLVEAPAKRLHHVTFTLRPGTTDAVRAALERSGTPVIEPPPGAPEDGLWLRDPDGTAVQLLDEPPAPAHPAAEVLV